MEVGARLDRLRLLLDLSEVHGLLVTNLANLSYLTGVTG